MSAQRRTALVLERVLQVRGWVLDEQRAACSAAAAAAMQAAAAQHGIERELDRLDQRLREQLQPGVAVLPGEMLALGRYRAHRLADHALACTEARRAQAHRETLEQQLLRSLAERDAIEARHGRVRGALATASLQAAYRELDEHVAARVAVPGAPHGQD
jgi:hypothetical protein